MKSSPITMRIAELRMRSEPMIGPTVETLAVCAAPNRATSALRRSSNGVPAGSGTGEPVAPGLATGLGVGLGDGVAVGDREAEGLADPEAMDVGEGVAAPLATIEGSGAGVEGGRRSTGFVLTWR